MTRYKAVFRFLHYQKYLALFLILIGIPMMIFRASPGSEIPLMIGLFTLMISLEKTEDERSVNLRTTSLYMAFVLAYTVKIVVSHLHANAWITSELVEINHFIILVMALANCIFYGRLYLVRS